MSHKIPAWMIQKVRIQSQRRSNKYSRSTPSNKITILRKWHNALEEWARQVSTTVIDLVTQADLVHYPEYLLPPNK